MTPWTDATGTTRPTSAEMLHEQAESDARMATHCHDDRHAEPCPLPCAACADECELPTITPAGEVLVVGVRYRDGKWYWTKDGEEIDQIHNVRPPRRKMSDSRGMDPGLFF